MHAELMAFMAANQAGRQDALPVDLADRDLRRSVRVRQILANTPPETLDQADLFAAARICRHGPDPENQEKARELLLAQVEGRIVDRARFNPLRARRRIMKRQSVGLVCGHYDPSRDGVADYTRHLQEYLERAGVRAVICTAQKNASTPRRGVVGVTSAWNVRGAVQAARRLRKLRLDIVHVQFAPSAFGFSRGVGVLPLLLRAPLVVTLHEYGVWTADGITGHLRSAGWSILERHGYVDRETLLLTPRADRVLVVSDEHARLLQQRFPDSTITATVVPVGPNIPVSTIDRGRARSMVRQDLGMAADAPLVLFFGFQHRVKALDRLIAAAALVHAQFPGLHLVLAGGAESHSVTGAAATALRRELEEVARLHNVADRVTFTGYLPAADVSCLLQAADVAVFPFDTGVTAKSGSLLAARTHGLPVIATAAPGIVTRPTEMDGVLRVPPKDTAALAEALKLVLANRTVAERLAAVNRSRAAASTWEAIVGKHLQAYDAVMRRRRHRLG